MKSFVANTLWLLVTTIGLYAVDAPEFEQLQASYKAAVEKAVKPLNQSYITELENLRAKYAKAADLESANKVQAEIDAVYMGIAFNNTANVPVSAPVATSGANAINVTIPADNPNGYKIGPLKKGAVITLSYRKGAWKPDGKLATDRPDAEKPERGEQSRLVIAHGRYKTQGGPVLAVVPAGTAGNPFSYTLNEDIDNVVLRINEDGNEFADNPGSVIYHLKVTK